MDFTTDKYSQRYCNPSHKELAYRLRKAERLRNAPQLENPLTLIPSTESIEFDPMITKLEMAMPDPDRT